MDPISQFILDASGSPLALLAVLVLTIADGICPLVPSESVVIGLAAIGISTGHPPLLLLGLVAALGALIGDNITFQIGRRIGLDRFGWMRRPWFTKVMSRASAALERRVSTAVLAGRFVPGGRVAVNLVAGASGVPPRVFRPLTVVSSICWAGYSLVLGTVAGAWFGAHPLLGALLAMGLGVLIGWLIDTAMAVRRRLRSVRPAEALDLEPVRDPDPTSVG
jgi:membrane protein DedA with SNARE-associated domain